MPTEYEKFEGLYAQFADLANHGYALTNGKERPTKQLKELAMAYAGDITGMSDPAVLLSIQNTKDSEYLGAVMQNLAGFLREDTEKASKGRLEAILSGIPDEEFLEFLVNTTNPRDSYEGSKGSIYKRVADAKKKVISMQELAASGDEEKIVSEVTKNYEAMYDTNDKKQARALALTKSLMAINPEIVQYRFNIIYNEAQADFKNKVEGNKAGYVAASIEPEIKDGKMTFVDYYSQVTVNFQQAKEKAQKDEARRAEQTQSAPRRRTQRRAA